MVIKHARSKTFDFPFSQYLWRLHRAKCSNKSQRTKNKMKAEIKRITARPLKQELRTRWNSLRKWFIHHNIWWKQKRITLAAILKPCSRMNCVTKNRLNKNLLSGKQDEVEARVFESELQIHWTNQTPISKKSWCCQDSISSWILSAKRRKRSYEYLETPLQIWQFLAREDPDFTWANRTR